MRLAHAILPVVCFLAFTSSPFERAYGVELNFVNETGLDIRITYNQDLSTHYEDLTFSDVAGVRTWHYATPSVPDTWIVTPTFQIQIPGRPKGGTLNVALKPMTLSLSFQLRALFEVPRIDIPVRLIPSTSGTDFEDVEEMSTADRFAQTILYAQFAKHYSTEDPDSAFARRIVNSWFYAQYELMKSTRSETVTPLRFSSDLIAAVRNVFKPEDPSRAVYEAKIREWETLFWKIPDRDYKFVLRNGRCDVAPLVINYVGAQDQQDSEAATVQGVSADEQIGKMQQLFERRCLGNRPIETINAARSGAAG